MSEVRFPLFTFSLLCLLGTGCAQTTFPAGSLPAQFAALPARDYSTLDLTPHAQSRQHDARIVAGDRLQVHLNSGAWGETSDQIWSVEVDPNGNAELPHIGSVTVAGYSTVEAKDAIVEASLERDVFRTPVINVRVEDRTAGTVAVRGAVARPGEIAVPGGGIKLADAIVSAGGLTNKASGIVHLSGSASVLQDPQAASQSANNTLYLGKTLPEELAQIIVPVGATVSVEMTPQHHVQLIGVINNTNVEIPPGKDLRLLDALTLAGGPRYSGWILDKVFVIRKVPGQDETVRIAASIRGAKSNVSENILLAPNDIVSVEENLATFSISTLQALFGVGRSAALLTGAP